jgi:uncharacterized protein YkwD
MTLRNFSAGVLVVIALASAIQGAPTRVMANAAPGYAEQLAVEVNAFRAANGKPPLKLNLVLNQAAADYSQDMGQRNFFGHNDPDNGCNTPGKRVTGLGYAGASMVSENVAVGFPTPGQTQIAFANSSGHRANMLSSTARELGTGYYHDNSDAGNVRMPAPNGCPSSASVDGPFYHYWTELFASRVLPNGQEVMPIIINGEAITSTSREVEVYIYGPRASANRQANAADRDVQIRFFHDGCWTVWEPWSETVNYVFPAGSATRQLSVEIKVDGVSQISTDEIRIVDDTPNIGTPPRVCALSLNLKLHVPSVQR